MGLKQLGRRGNLQLAKDEDRAFPGLLVQGDSVFVLLQDLDEVAPQSVAAITVRDWIAAYEEMMIEAGLSLPYYRGPAA